MKKRISFKEKIRQIKMGKREPQNPTEWAIWNDYLTQRNRSRIADLHAQSAIHKAPSMAGKIIVIPPKT